jgi:predicted TIM-barrel fold metal-dependent hydrolase
MIYDGHAYIFPDLKGDGGFEDRLEFQRHLQLAMATHFMPAWRKRDRAPADNSGLIDESKPRVFDALKDANFRATSFGRFEWTVDGEDYVKHYMPPLVMDMEFTDDDLVAEMDYAEVDYSLLHRSPYVGIGNDLVADAVQKHPDRIQALAHVPEWRIASEPDWAIAELDRAINDLGLHGLQLLPDYAEIYGQSSVWDADDFTPFWDHFAKMNVPLFVTPGLSSLARADSGKGMDLSEYETITRFTQKYPDVPIVLTHGLSWRAFANEDGIDVPDAVFDALPTDNPNFHIQLMFAIFFGGMYDYPMPQIRPTLEKVVERFGADRLMWGTDVPIVMRFQTYRQSLDSLRLNLDFLDQADIDLICGGNVARLMGVG